MVGADARGYTHEGESADEFRGDDSVPPAQRDACAFAAVERRDGRVSLRCVSGRNESGKDLRKWVDSGGIESNI